VRVTWITKKENGMPKRKSLPHFSTYEEASEWLDTHSTANLYATPAKFTIASNLRVVIVDSHDNPIETIPLKKRMSRTIRQIAQRNGISSQQLIKDWLQEKIQEQSQLSI